MNFYNVMEELLDKQCVVQFRPIDDGKIYCAVETGTVFGEGTGNTVDFALESALRDTLQLARKRSIRAQDDTSLLSKCIEGMEEEG